jgi:dihydrodipicolinate reductase
MIRVAVAGAAGRMGKTLIEAIGASDHLVVTAGFEHAEHPRLGEDLGVICGLGPLGVILDSEPDAHSSCLRRGYRFHHTKCDSHACRPLLKAR